MRELVKLPNQLLRQKSKPVKKIDSKIEALAKEMVQFIQLYQEDNLRALSVTASQLGELVRVIAFRRNPMSFGKDDIQVVINPELVYQKGNYLATESCLSIPGRKFTVRRGKIVKIRGLTLDNEVRSFRGHGLLAQVFQHQIDLLNGVLIDRIGERRAR
ncbi:Peptide deformylase [subsurface metagenome]